ncbi:E3 SUMO-protein ligase ZBED1-like [Microplitis demolitor]|uniref:E3 SUMO-protein ligase ZBED1-like n=1 Tax=Microplitis demolitor TaxID=69319 RepID=UPI00235B5E47|nr:E3 SUMO-protein ligase ZBED1-like [Microplitis demolitor]
MQKQMDIPVLKLKQDVLTRWNSTYEMLNRVLKIKNAIIATLALMNNNLSLTTEDWIVIERVVPILKIFNDITVEVCTEKTVSLSKVIVYCRLLKQHVNDCLKLIETQTFIEKENYLVDIHNLLETLRSEIYKRFMNIEKNFLYTKSTVLDPRFKYKGFREEVNYKKTIDGLKSKIVNTRNELSISSLVVNSSTTVQTEVASITASSLASDKIKTVSIWDKFDQEIACLTPENSTAAGIVELDIYLHEPIMNRNENPLDWWNSRKNVYPILVKFILKRLNLVATSVPCERVFSKAGLIQTEKRSRLSASKMSQLLFISGNLQN